MSPIDPGRTSPSTPHDLAMLSLLACGYCTTQRNLTIWTRVDPGPQEHRGPDNNQRQDRERGSPHVRAVYPLSSGQPPMSNGVRTSASDLRHDDTQLLVRNESHRGYTRSLSTSLQVRLGHGPSN